MHPTGYFGSLSSRSISRMAATQSISESVQARMVVSVSIALPNVYVWPILQ